MIALKPRPLFPQFVCDETVGLHYYTIISSLLSLSPLVSPPSPGTPAPPLSHTCSVLWQQYRGPQPWNMTEKPQLPQPQSSKEEEIYMVEKITPLLLYIQCNLGITFVLYHFFWGRQSSVAYRPAQIGSCSPLVHPTTTKWVWRLASCVSTGFEDFGFELCVSSIPYAKLNLNLRRAHEGGSISAPLG